MHIYIKIRNMSTNAPVLSKIALQYRRRKPEYSPYYQCIEDYYEEFKRSYDRNFSQKYGYLRPHIEKVIYQYLDCGILHNGFARLKCRGCGHEKLLAFSCKRRHFCPSCHAKRCVEFGEWLCSNVLKKVPHRHFVFSIPKILRIYFLFNRNLLKELSRISWEVIKDYYKSTCRKDGGSPAAVAVIQTFGDYLSFNPHMHVLAADGCFSEGFFYVPSINIDTASIEKLFIHRIFKMLLRKGLITERVIELISSWAHTGFGVYCGKMMNPKDAKSTENLARYIIRASFSQERMKYYPDKAKVTYKSKYGKDVKEFSCLERMAALVCHIPDRGGQTLRYYGHYSNVTRGRLKKEKVEPEFHIIEDESPGRLNRSWARLIQKIYEVDPLLCPRCGKKMKIIAFIEDYKIVKKILDYLRIYEFERKRPPPKIESSPDEFDDYIRDDYIDCDHVC